MHECQTAELKQKGECNDYDYFEMEKRGKTGGWTQFCEKWRYPTKITSKLIGLQHYIFVFAFLKQCTSNFVLTYV